MWASCPGARVSRHANLLSGIDSIAHVHVDARHVHIGGLILAAILTVILNRHGLATASVGIVVHTNHLAVVLCSK